MGPRKNGKIRMLFEPLFTENDLKSSGQASITVFMRSWVHI